MIVTHNVKGFRGRVESYTVKNGVLIESTDGCILSDWYTDKYTWQIEDGKLWVFNESRSVGTALGYIITRLEQPNNVA